MKESELNGRQTTSSKKVNNNNHHNNNSIKLKNGGGTKKGGLKLSTPKSNHSLTTTTNKMGSNHSSSKSSSKSNSPKKGKAGSNKQSQELRPRRRASQTYFFKYQLARNPLKAEEEDLKLALLASLQQCNNNSKSNKNNKKNINNNNNKNNNSTIKKLSIDKAKKGKKVTKINIASKTSRSSNSSSSTTSSTINGPLSIKSQDDLSELTSSSTSTYTTPEPNESSIHLINEANKPETEDFLSFICLRTTAPNYQNNFSNDTSSNTIIYTTPTKTNKNELNNLRCNTNSTPTKFLNYNNNNIHSPIANINYRRPIRQSPRLANSHHRKISENNDTSNTIITANAYDNSITYEEDLKRASIALEDMAQEISCSSETNNNEIAQKHLVKGLMTREFAGAFADEETIFESISNHIL